MTDKLLEMARGRCRDEEEFAVVRRAYDFAREAHKGFTLRSGEPFFNHPVAVAEIVISMIGLGYKSISAALLHDVTKNSDHTAQELVPLFGEKIAGLVEGLTNIRQVLGNIDYSRSEEVLQDENFKRILLSMGGDVRVVIVKLADRLDNCRRLDTLTPSKAAQVLSEAKVFFIPLAHRLGLYGIKSEMEDIWFRHTHPSVYSEIVGRVNIDAAQRSRDIEAFIAPISDALTSLGLRFEIKKRIKTPYSIWNKMRNKHISLEQIYDLYAVRIIFEEDSRDSSAERDRAFEIYRIVTRMYPSKQSRLRNWIDTPKANGYEALHCTLMSNAGIWIEVQIRSRRMDDIAEKGVAAHWAYKNDGYLSEDDSQMDSWLAKIQGIINSDDVNSLDMLDMIQDDITAKSIFVFTPMGRRVGIPKDSTALDFAYYVHTDIGNQAIAAKVNQKLTPLSCKLHSGDQVEIITARKSCPKADWLGFLQTRHARRKVSEYLREHDPEALRKAEEMRRMMGVAGASELPFRITLRGRNRPGLIDDIKSALRRIDGIEDVVTSEL